MSGTAWSHCERPGRKPDKETGMSTIKQAVDDLLDPQLSVQASIDRHFVPAFRQRVNGSWIDRATFLDSIVGLRAALDHATVTVLDELVTGAHYAERHRIELFMRDGSLACQEVYVFAQRDADGRFVCIEEATIAIKACGRGHG